MALADEIKSWDQTPSDNWTQSGEVMVHGKDFRRTFFDRVLGSGEKITAAADFKDGELQKLEADVYNVSDGHFGGSESRKYKYEISPDGEVSYTAPREIKRYSETVEVGRSKTSTYYEKIDHVDITHTSVCETRDGTLIVDLEPTVVLDDYLTPIPRSAST